MRFLYALPLIAAIGFLAARPGVSMPNASMPNAYPDTLAYPEETHFKNIRQLTFGGDNAEAYFSYDGKYLIFQKTNPKEGIQCDQIYIGKVPTSPNEPFVPKLVSTGKGRTTCGYFMKDGKHVVYG
ncbi:MAG: hypothetical protein WBP58_00230, partial [Chitinophagaceae bacterium]